jgi:hypothetical protein
VRTLALGLLLTTGAGCLHIQPVGPLAGQLGSPSPQSPAGDSDAPEPVVRQAPKPTPPALYVTPAEVNGMNAEEAAKRLGQELETDRRSMDAMPNVSEVSVVNKK